MKVPESLPKGAGLLQQGQTVITLVDVDGKRYAIGKDANVLKVTETDLHIQQNAGGGSVELKVSLNSLSQTTLEELSRLGLGSGAEGTLAMAAYRIGQIHEDSAAVKREVIDQLLDEAAHKKAPEDQVATLKRWLAFMDREDQARTAWAALEEALAKKSHEKAKNAYDGFRKEFATTAVFAAMAPRFSEIENQLEGIAKSPGLYGGCWKASKDNQFSELVFQDVVRKVGWEKGDNARDKRFPNDWFSVRYGGLLRITQAGSYKFHFSADDWVRVWIDGKQVANGTPIELTQRDHPFRLEYGDSIRSDWLHLEWVPPGENNKVKIPDNVFWHLPSERESYLRLPAKPQ